MSNKHCRPRMVDVCGVYPGAIGWEVDAGDLDDAQLAEQLATSAGCEYYTVGDTTYGPFDHAKK